MNLTNRYIDRFKPSLTPPQTHTPHPHSHPTPYLLLILGYHDNGLLPIIFLASLPLFKLGKAQRQIHDDGQLVKVVCMVDEIGGREKQRDS